LDRDGVINDLVYDEEEGKVSSPFAARELRVFPYVGSAVRQFKEMGFKVIVISNQPGVAKRQFTLSELDKMNRKVRKALSASGTSFDGEYYCLHHPSSLVAKYRLECGCRKPKPGMLLEAADEHDIDLSRSYFIGDALVDVKAGKRAGCNTVMVGSMTSHLAEFMRREDAIPDFMIGSLKEAPDLLVALSSGDKPSAKKRGA